MQKKALTSALVMPALLAALMAMLPVHTVTEQASANEFFKLEPDKTGTVTYQKQVKRTPFGCRFVNLVKKINAADRAGLATTCPLPDGLHIGMDNNYESKGAVDDRCYRFDGKVSVGLLHFDVNEFKTLGAPGPRQRIRLRADVSPATQQFYHTKNRKLESGAEFQGNRCAFLALGTPQTDWAQGDVVLPVIKKGTVSTPLAMVPPVSILRPVLNSTYDRFDVDVTDIVLDWLSGERDNLGFAILPWEARDGQTIQMVRDDSYCMASAYNWRLVLLDESDL